MKSPCEDASAFRCINAIGNSLDLHEMLTEVITTVIDTFGAMGGKFLSSRKGFSEVIHVGDLFDTSAVSTHCDERFHITNGVCGNTLHLPTSNGMFLFCFNHETALERVGSILSSFRLKLSNAIEACYHFEQLQNLNLHLIQQVTVEKSKNEVNEKLMISQSRLAIMGEMIGMIAHQWRQPITVIGMVSNNALLDIQLGEINEDQLISDLKLIDKQVHFLSGTIDDFRNFFRPNKLPQLYTFGEIETELNTILGTSFKHHQITLLFEGGKDIGCITYKNELLQVFLNILSNAKDAFSEQNTQIPLIRFRLLEHPDSLQFQIIDNGGGIKDEILGRIFEPYFSTKSEKHGTGLGLYMSAMIVEKHLKGSLSVSSENQESIFSITIPKAIYEERGNVS